MDFLAGGAPRLAALQKWRCKCGWYDVEVAQARSLPRTSATTEYALDVPGTPKYWALQKLEERMIKRDLSFHRPV